MPVGLKRKAPLPAHLIRAVSVEAEADARTVQRVLRGEPVLPLPKMRIERVLRERGLFHVVAKGRSAL